MAEIVYTNKARKIYRKYGTTLSIPGLKHRQINIMKKLLKGVMNFSMILNGEKTIQILFYI